MSYQIFIVFGFDDEVLVGCFKRGNGTFVIDGAGWKSLLGFFVSGFISTLVGIS